MNRHPTLHPSRISIDFKGQSRRPYESNNASMARLCPGTNPWMEVPPLICKGIQSLHTQARRFGGDR